MNLYLNKNESMNVSKQEWTSKQEWILMKDH